MIKTVSEPECPYCGKLMRLVDNAAFPGAPGRRVCYRCSNCGARTPLTATEDMALRAALEVNRTEYPMLIGVNFRKHQFVTTGVTAWYEWKYSDEACIEPAIITEDGELLTQDMLVDRSNLDWASYYETWRLWSHKPSNALRERIPWGKL